MPPPLSPAARLAVRALARPWPLAAVAVLALSPAAWSSLARVGISADVSQVFGLIYELAFMGALAGALAGLQSVEEWAWLLRRWQPGETLRLEGTVLGMTAALLAGVPLLASPLAGPGLPAAPLAGLALAVFQVVAAALLLRRLPLSAGGRILALLAVCWWIPAVLAPSFPFGLGLAPRALASAGGAGPALLSPRMWVAGTSLGIALAVAARLELGRAAR